jgi:hypothetical protein
VYSLKQAADAVSRGKPAILKAIKSGRISAHKDANGQWQIDPAELHRVYPMVTGNGSGTATGEREEIPRSLSSLDREIELLRQRLGEKDELIADLRIERDRLLAVIETQATQVKQLTDGRPAQYRSWWQRLFG